MIRINRKERNTLLKRDPRMEDVFGGLIAQHRFSRAVYTESRYTIALARKFNDEVVGPLHLAIDRAVRENNDFLPVEFIQKANEWGFYTLWLPRLFGGGGMNFISLYPFLEEIASVCTGLANVIGVHYLGVAGICAGWNLPLINRVFREVRRGETNGVPCILSLAVTEPGAGTDVEETELLDRARIETIARKVAGGYLVNGKKIFISNGHVSTWHITLCYEDSRAPSETMLVLAVKNGMGGFSFGAKEHKMGQKSCVASELLFEDCFVPDELVCSPRSGPGVYAKSAREINQLIIDFIVSSSRPAVAAFAAGAARGAYEKTVRYAVKKRVRGDYLINHQWVQTALAEMYKNVNESRTVYMESAYMSGLYGMFKILYKPPVFHANRLVPRWIYSLLSPFLNTGFASFLARKYYFDRYKRQEAEASSGWGSLVKFSCSDRAVANASMALDLMGIDGARHDSGAEKYLRDAKLLQIYEGTNQLNRLNLFKSLVGRGLDNVTMF